MKAAPKILMIAVMALTTFVAFAQRRITPVNNAATATQHINENPAARDSLLRRNVIEMTDSKGNVILVDTITGNEWVDSTAIAERQIPKMIYPFLHSISLSVDLFQPAMRLFGQHYGLIGFGAELNMHNRYIAVIEAGLGKADYDPEDNNYHYRTPVAPYIRIGANYNFFYNSNPDYLLMAGIRYGFSPFSFSVDDISQTGGYWDEDLHYSIPSQNVTAGWFEVLLGLRVKIAGPLSLGWTVRYHSVIHQTSTPHGKAWYIPGYGTNHNNITATFSLAYTLPFPRHESTAREDIDQLLAQ